MEAGQGGRGRTRRAQTLRRRGEHQRLQTCWRAHGGRQRRREQRGGIIECPWSRGRVGEAWRGGRCGCRCRRNVWLQVTWRCERVSIRKTRCFQALDAFTGALNANRRLAGGRWDGPIAAPLASLFVQRYWQSTTQLIHHPSLHRQSVIHPLHSLPPFRPPCAPLQTKCSCVQGARLIVYTWPPGRPSPSCQSLVLPQPLPYHLSHQMPSTSHQAIGPAARLRPIPEPVTAYHAACQTAAPVAGQHQAYAAVQLTTHARQPTNNG